MSKVSKQRSKLPRESDSTKPSKSARSTKSTRSAQSTRSTRPTRSTRSTKTTKSDLRLTEPQIESKNDQAPWRERCITADEESKWVGCYFDDQEVSFGTANPQKWRVQSKYCAEKVWKSKIEPRSACAVYKCTQTSGEHPGMEAVMKIHMQIPNFRHEDPRGRPEETSYRIDQEVTALAMIRAAQSDIPAPRLIATKTELQTDEMWVPGGYICIIVMQKLPGTALNYDMFWGSPRAKRDEIRLAFRAALEKIWSVRVSPHDYGLRNILWDEATKKCYVIDLEDAGSDGGRSRFREGVDYARWGLNQDPRMSSEGDVLEEW